MTSALDPRGPRLILEFSEELLSTAFRNNLVEQVAQALRPSTPDRPTTPGELERVTDNLRRLFLVGHPTNAANAPWSFLFKNLIGRGISYGISFATPSPDEIDLVIEALELNISRSGASVADTGRETRRRVVVPSSIRIVTPTAEQYPEYPPSVVATFRLIVIEPNHDSPRLRTSLEDADFIGPVSPSLRAEADAALRAALRRNFSRIEVGASSPIRVPIDLGVPGGRIDDLAIMVIRPASGQAVLAIFEPREVLPTTTTLTPPNNFSVAIQRQFFMTILCAILRRSLQPASVTEATAEELRRAVAPLARPFCSMSGWAAAVGDYLRLSNIFQQGMADGRS